jgi:hypothetical protein
MLGMEPQKSVLVKEPKQGGRGELQHLIRWRAPNSTAHWDEIVIDEIGTVPPGVAVLSQRLRLPLRVVESRDGFRIEPVDGQEQSVVGRPKQVPALDEQAIETGSIELQSARTVLHTERHGSGLGWDTEFPKKTGQQWIGDVVEDHETSVEGHVTANFLDVDGMSVPSRTVVLFKQGQVELFPQKIGAAQSGDTGTDDGETFLGHD